LQKTMLTAEGTGRKLDPNANMWVLARPLIEDWVIHTLGPEARFVEGAADIASAMRRLPVLLDNLDKGAAALADGRLRLHPETVRALRGEQKFAGLGWPVIAVAAAVIILSLIL